MRKYMTRLAMMVARAVTARMRLARLDSDSPWGTLLLRLRLELEELLHVDVDVDVDLYVGDRQGEVEQGLQLAERGWQRELEEPEEGDLRPCEVEQGHRPCEAELLHHQLTLFRFRFASKCSHLESAAVCIPFFHSSLVHISRSRQPHLGIKQGCEGNSISVRGRLLTTTFSWQLVYKSTVC